MLSPPLHFLILNQLIDTTGGGGRRVGVHVSTMKSSGQEHPIALGEIKMGRRAAYT